VSYALAIFDFDGTLADSFHFLAGVFNELAERHGFHAIASEEVPALRRLHARELMRRVGLPARKLPGVAKDFIARMRENRSAIAPFPGAAELLADLAFARVRVAIVSSNSHDNVAGVLGAQATAAVRHFACGMSIFGKRAHLRRVLRQSGVARERALYIGDQAADLEAARAEGIAFGAVSWGYGDAAHLEALGAQHRFDRMSDIAAFFKTPAESH
jgi:phosphoglycolate phosphatase